ncbi:MAG: MBL fold metallo-hydrolase [Erysipelotrichaceae bacterium]|nr:MBL fold metallo-hydrolase [Erysipelotrichaceae bacterium]
MEKVFRLVLSMMQTNCYLLKEDGHVLIIDPASSTNRIMSFLEENEEVDGILLTHGHFDHIGAADMLRKKLHCPIYIHSFDKRLATDVSIDRFGTDIVVKSPLNEYQCGKMKIGSFELEILHTPGHTDGSVCIGYKNHLFTGDTLFQCSVGRCDLFSGSDSKLKQSLRLLAQKHPDTLIYPGHGETTILHDELLMNPYFNQL